MYFLWTSFEAETVSISILRTKLVDFFHNIVFTALFNLFVHVKFTCFIF
jgi:hypothetical protein